MREYFGTVNWIYTLIFDIHAAESRMISFKITVVVFSELIVYVWYSMLFFLQMVLKSSKSFKLMNMIFNLFEACLT